MSESDTPADTLDRPSVLPDEAYRLEDNTGADATRCSHSEGHDEYVTPPAMWRVDLMDSGGEFFVAVCDDEQCVNELADTVEEWRESGTTVLPGEE